MRIALLSHSYVPEVYAGREIHVWNLAKELSGKNEVTVIVGDNVKGVKRMNEDGVDTIRIPRVLIPAVRKPHTYYRVMPKLYRVLCENSFDIIHTHGLRHFNSEIAGLYCKKTQTPLVLSYHGYLLPGVSRVFARLYDLSIAKGTIGTASRIICVSRMQLDDLKHFYGGSVADKSLIIPNAIADCNPSKYSVRGELGLQNKRIVLGIGRLIPRKGFDTLVKSFSDVINSASDAHLLMMGRDSGSLNDLKILAEKEGISEHVSFIDSVPWHDALSVISESSAIVVPSTYEGLPTVLLEAMSLGTPVIVSDIPSFEGVIEHGVNGLVFECGNEKSLSLMINRILLNQSLARRLSRSARRSVKNYHWKNVSKKIMNVYKSVLDESVNQ